MYRSRRRRPGTGSWCRCRRPQACGQPTSSIEVFATVAGCGVHEAGAGIIGDVVAVEQRHVEFIAAAETLEGMRAGHRCEVGRRDIAQALVLQLGLGEGFLGQLIGKDQLFAGTRTKIVLGRRHLVETVGDTRGKGDRAVAGDRPVAWSSR